MSKIEIRKIEKFETTAFNIQNFMYDFGVVTGMASPLMSISQQAFSIIRWFGTYFIGSPGKAPSALWYPIFT